MTIIVFSNSKKCRQFDNLRERNPVIFKTYCISWAAYLKEIAESDNERRFDRAVARLLWFISRTYLTKKLLGESICSGFFPSWFK